MSALSFTKCFVNFAFLCRVWSTVDPGVMCHFVHILAKQLGLILIPEHPDAGRIHKGAISAQINTVNRLGSRIEEESDLFFALLQLAGSLLDTLLELVAKLMQGFFGQLAGECITCEAPVGTNKRYCPLHAKLEYLKQKAREANLAFRPHVYHCGYCGETGHQITTCKKVEASRL